MVRTRRIRPAATSTCPFRIDAAVRIRGRIRNRVDRPCTRRLPRPRLPSILLDTGRQPKHTNTRIRRSIWPLIPLSCDSPHTKRTPRASSTFPERTSASQSIRRIQIPLDTRRTPCPIPHHRTPAPASARRHTRRCTGCTRSRRRRTTRTRPGTARGCCCTQSPPRTASTPRRASIRRTRARRTRQGGIVCCTAVVEEEVAKPAQRWQW